MMELHDYGAKAEHVCNWPRRGYGTALVFGVELEVEPRSFSSQRAILNALPEHADNDYFCKTDGSLNSGVEIVTIPGTLEWHQGSFGWAGTLAPLAAIAMSGSRTQRCGMHIHVNRAALSQLTIAKLYLFVNEPGNLRFVETIAQRANNHWAAMAKKKWNDAKSRRHMASHGRYQAVNHTGATLELRLFRGTIRTDRLLKNVEFAHALVRWSETVSCARLAWQSMVGYIDENAATYPNLAAFITEMGVNA